MKWQIASVDIGGIHSRFKVNLRKMVLYRKKNGDLKKKIIHMCQKIMEPKVL